MTLRTRKPLRRTPFKRKPVVKREKPVKNVLPPLTAAQKRELGPLVLGFWGPFCHYCRVGLTPQTVCFDHILARSQGGDHSLKNLLPCCRSCNSWKGAKPFEWAMANVAARRKSAKITSHIGQPIHIPLSTNNRREKK